MKGCPYCGYKNREGLFFCEECGQGLTDTADSARATHQFDASSDQSSPVKTTWGTASVDQISAIIMHIRNAADPLVIELADAVVLGRADETSPRQPTIDLTPYGALEKGVSRLHASIDRSDDVLTLVDIGSANGTYLNGYKLAKDQPRVLRDGDEVRFGKLIAHIYFK